MKKYLLLGMMISSFSFSQSKFAPASLVKKDGTSEQVMVKMQNLNTKVESFTIKQNDAGKESTVFAKDIESITYGQGTKFVSVLTNFSRFDDIKLEENTYVQPEEKEILLRVILEGNNSLYQYNDSNSRAFFYSNKNGEVKQLINKRYYQDSNVVTDASYKKELSSVFGIPEDNKDIKYLEYYEEPLKKFFIKYAGASSDANVKIFEEKTKTGNFSMGIVAGLVNSSLSMDYKGAGDGAKSDSYKFSNLGFLIGLNLEYKLNFFSGAVFIQPSFQSFSDEQNSMSDASKKAKLDYNNFILPFGIKYDFVNYGKSTVSAKAMGILYLPMNAKTENLMDYSYVGQSYNIDAKMGFGLGLSYEYNKKVSAEVRYTLPRQLVQNNDNYTYSKLWDTEYNSISFILGYRIF